MINLAKKNLEKLLSVLCVVYSNLSLGDQNYGIFDGFSSLDVLFLDRENLKMKIINIQHFAYKNYLLPRQVEYRDWIRSSNTDPIIFQSEKVSERFNSIFLDKFQKTGNHLPISVIWFHLDVIVKNIKYSNFT